MSPDPASWKVVERGWRVLGPDGKELGTVDEVRGDVDADIFNGLQVLSGLLSSASYVPAERVTEIREGEVVLDGDSL
jgi:hypothetical protein